MWSLGLWGVVLWFTYTKMGVKRYRGGGVNCSTIFFIFCVQFLGLIFGLFKFYILNQIIETKLRKF